MSSLFFVCVFFVASYVMRDDNTTICVESGSSLSFESALPPLESVPPMHVTI